MHEFGPFTFWELLALIAAVSVVLGWLGVVIVHRRLEGRVGESHNEVVIPIYATAGVIYAVLLAFVVIAVWEQFTGAEDNVASEASSLTTLYRETAAMPPSQQVAVRRLLRGYTEAVAGTEWNAMRRGGTSAAAREDLIELYAVIGRPPASATNAALDEEFVAELSTMSSARTKRILDGQGHLPWILWLSLIAGAVVVVAMGWFLYMPSVGLHAGLSATVAALVGLLLFTTLVLDRPFSGRLGIKPDAFEHAVSVFDSVDQTRR